MRGDDEIDGELRLHINERVADLAATGVSPGQARRRARLEVGGGTQTEEVSRDPSLWSLVNGFVQDFRLAVRLLRGTPVVTAVAVLSLALGIGANTAIFSLVNSLLLRQLPVKDPARLVFVKADESGGLTEWNYAVWEQIRERREIFEGVTSYSPTARANLTVADDAQTVDGLFASGSFFATLGVPAVIGRTFSDVDDRRGGGPDGPVTVISYGFWQRRFHGAEEVVGQKLEVENVPFTVIGVMPPDFFGPEVGRTFDVIVPLGVEPLVSRRETRLDNRSAAWLNIIARLKPNQTIADATAALRGVQAHIWDVTRPPWSRPPLDRYLQQTFIVVPAATGDSRLRRSYKSPLITILVVVALVLVIACANIANLLLARATTRRHELSVRLALGASRWRLSRQLLVESMVLAATGAAFGLVIASWGSGVLVRQLSTQTQTVFLDLSIDQHVLLFTVAISAATALLFGMAPALHVSSIAPMDAMKERGQATQRLGAHRAGISSALVVAQIALSLVLVVAAGLFVRTFIALTTRDLGFKGDRVLVVSVNAHSASIEPTQRLRIYDEVRNGVRLLPGVADAALSAQTPPIVNAMILPIQQVSGGLPLQGRELGERMGLLSFVGPGSFSTFGTPIKAGRDFTDEDRKGAPPVALVNQAFARKFLNGANPIGHTIAASAPELTLDIIGVVDDAVYRSVRAPVQPTVFVPLAQASWAPNPLMAQLNLGVRANHGSPALLAKSVAAAIHEINPELVLTFATLSDQVHASLAQERIIAMLSGFFGVLALLLAALGLYGVMSYAVSRRKAEIGIRMALGAPPTSVVRLILNRVAALVGIGITIGGLTSLWASTFVASLLFGLEPHDPITLLGAALTLLGIGALAGWLPARRASRIDPAEVLRES